MSRMPMRRLLQVLVDEDDPSMAPRHFAMLWGTVAFAVLLTLALGIWCALYVYVGLTLGPLAANITVTEFTLMTMAQIAVFVFGVRTSIDMVRIALCVRLRRPEETS